MAPEIEKIQVMPADCEAAKAAAEEERKKKAEEAEEEAAKKSAENPPVFSEDASKVKTDGNAAAITKPSEKSVKAETPLFGELTSNATSPDRTKKTTTVSGETKVTDPIKREKVSGTDKPSGSAFGYGNQEDLQIGDSFGVRAESSASNNKYITEESGLEKSVYVTMDDCIAESKTAFYAVLNDAKAKTGSSKNAVSSESIVVQFAESNSQEIIRINAEEKYALANAKTQETKTQITTETAQKYSTLVIDKCVSPQWQELAENGTLSDEEVKTGSLTTSEFMKLMYTMRTQSIKDQETLDAYAVGQTQSIEPIREQLVGAVTKVMPENTTKESAEKMIEATSTYVTAQKDYIVKTVSNGKYSSSVKSTILDMCKHIVERIVEKTKNFIKKFFETVKGKLILNQARRVEHEVKVAKKEYTESLEDVEAAKEQAEIAKEQSEKAMEEAQKAEAQAKSLIAQATKQSEIKLKDVDPTSSKFMKYVKSLSLQTALKLADSQEEKKKAYWVKWDADSALRLANSAAEIARKSLEIARTRMTAMMINISSYFG